jgi:hypothetical protein
VVIVQQRRLLPVTQRRVDDLQGTRLILIETGRLVHIVDF